MRRGEVVEVDWQYSDLRTVGYFSDAAMRRIGDCLKTVLELP